MEEGKRTATRPQDPEDLAVEVAWLTLDAKSMRTGNTDKAQDAEVMFKGRKATAGSSSQSTAHTGTTTDNRYIPPHLRASGITRSGGIHTGTATKSGMRSLDTILGYIRLMSSIPGIISSTTSVR